MSFTNRIIKHFFFILKKLIVIIIIILVIMRGLIISISGRVDDLSFIDYSSPFCFLLNEFHCIFSISFKIIPFYVY